MERDRIYGQGKRYYVTNYALESSGKRYRRFVNGERRERRKGYDIAEGSCFMADIEFDAAGTVKSVRYDLVRPARKV